MIALGVDPDLHSTGLALVELDETDRFSVLRVGVARVPSKIKGKDAVIEMASKTHYEVTRSLEDKRVDLVVVESQVIYLRSRVRPKDLLNLATVAGAALGPLQDSSEDRIEVLPRVLFPDPAEWKGQVPKEIHQRRIMERVSLNMNEIVVGQNDVKPSEWTHVVDAIGLACWGLGQAR